MERLDILLGHFFRRAPRWLKDDDVKTPILQVLSIRYRELLESGMLSEMRWIDIFAETKAEDLPPELHQLNRPRVLWYASAGDDFRPLVYTTPAYQTRLSERIEKPLQLPEPNLFVYTCLDEEYSPWDKGEVRCDDYGTRVTCRSATPIRLNRKLVPWANDQGYALFGLFRISSG